ncbi:MAG: hypothetical protein IJC79_08240 [Clostridia bacterium]|nr:hypothetical protein [Clostridia bacterium]
MQWLSQYGYLIIVFIVLLAVFAFVFMKAVSAYSKHNKTYKAQEAELKRLTALKEKYKNATLDMLETYDESEISEGMALLYQIALQKSDDMEEAFRAMPKEKQYVYVLDVFTQDGSAGEFFTQNSEILTSIIVEALNAIGMTAFASELSVFAKMFDKDDEDVSYSTAAIEKFDKMMQEKDILAKIKLSSSKYIKENYDILKC